MLRQLFTRIPNLVPILNGSTTFATNGMKSYFSTSSFLFSDSRYYSEKHEWIKFDDNNNKEIGTVGITDYAQQALGDVVYVQLPDDNLEIRQDEEVGAIESVKAANEIYTPVSGTIIQSNKDLETKPGLINSSPYENGWIFKIKLSNQAEVDGLMNEKAYDEYVKSVKH